MNDKGNSLPSPLHFSNYAHVILALGRILDSLALGFVALSERRDLMFFMSLRCAAAFACLLGQQKCRKAIWFHRLSSYQLSSRDADA